MSREPTPKWDFALLKLQRRVNNINHEDFIQLNRDYSQLDQETNLCILGYPGINKYKIEEKTAS